MAAKLFLDKVTTANPGTTFTAYADRACDAVRVSAPATNAVDVKIDGAGNIDTIPAGSSRTYPGVTNSNVVSVRRNDQSNTALDVPASVFSY
jgi:hypothetical protein